MKIINKSKVEKVTTKEGFTLIELLVVIAIISLLSTITLTFMQDARTRAEDTRIVSQVTQFQNAVALFVTEEGRYPIPTGSSITYSGNTIYCLAPSGSECTFLYPYYTINANDFSGADFAFWQENKNIFNNTLHASTMSDYINLDQINIPVIRLNSYNSLGGGILYGCSDSNCTEARVYFATNNPIRKGNPIWGKSYSVYWQAADDPGSGYGGSY
jgi:prepilin-type N-terminal cleavage/methylation domain-containing protein